MHTPPPPFRCMLKVSPVPGWGWEMGREGSRTQDRTASGGGWLTACRKGDWPPCWGSKAREVNGRRRLLSWWEGAVPGPTRRALGHRVSLGGNPVMKAEEGGVLGPHFSCLSASPPPALGYFRSSENTAKRTHRSCGPCGREGAPGTHHTWDSLHFAARGHMPHALRAAVTWRSGRGEPDLVSVHLLCVHMSDWGTELALMLGGPLERAGTWGLGGLGVESRLHSAGALGALPFTPL